MSNPTMGLFSRKNHAEAPTPLSSRSRSSSPITETELMPRFEPVHDPTTGTWAGSICDAAPSDAWQAATGQWMVPAIGGVPFAHAQGWNADKAKWYHMSSSVAVGGQLPLGIWVLSAGIDCFAEITASGDRELNGKGTSPIAGPCFGLTTCSPYVEIWAEFFGEIVKIVGVKLDVLPGDTVSVTISVPAPPSPRNPADLSCPVKWEVAMENVTTGQVATVCWDGDLALAQFAGWFVEAVSDSKKRLLAFAPFGRIFFDNATAASWRTGKQKAAAQGRLESLEYQDPKYRSGPRYGRVVVCSAQRQGGLVECSDTEWSRSSSRLAAVKASSEWFDKLLNIRPPGYSNEERDALKPQTSSTPGSGPTGG
jgi:Peptidase A4 family